MKTNNTKLIFSFTILYFTISLIGVLHHELWLDESHHFLLARDSNSITNLIENTRYEGHPILWNILLYIITKFTLDPFWMQFLHIIISTTVVYIFLTKTPFNWLFKILFIFGYFMLFEYNIISRNYNLGILFIFLACSVFQKRKNQFILLSFYLALALNTHFQFSIIAFAFFGIIFYEQIKDKTYLKKQNLFGYLIFFIGVISIMVQIKTTHSDWLLDPIEKMSFGERIIIGLSSLFKGLIPIPDFRSIHFWNSNLIINSNRSLAIMLSFLLYLIPLIIFSKNRKTLYFFYVGLIGAQIFFFITQRSAIRFHGITYLLFIIALWIENYYDIDNFKLKDYLSSIKLTLYKKKIIYSILFIHLFSGIYAYTMDIIHPFTSAKQAVQFVKNNYKENSKIITVSCEGTSLSAYSNKRIYSLIENNYQSYCQWNSDNFLNISEKNIIQLLTLYLNTNDSAIYISIYPITKNFKKSIWENINEKVKIRFAEKYDKNIVPNSYYYIYEVAKIK